MSQFYLGAELRIILLQGSGTVVLMIPKIFPQVGICGMIILFLMGVFLQITVVIQTRKAMIHETFLKGRLENYFDAHPGKAEDEKAEFYRHELNCSLSSIADQLGFNKSSNHRIRLFLPIENSGKRSFSLVAFHTDNSDLEYSRNSYYPDDGVLGEAWRTGHCYVDSLPDAANNPEQWKKSQRDYGYFKSAEAVNMVKFEARAYFAVAFRESEKDQKIGVIVIESALPYSISFKHTRRTIERQYSWYLGKCLEKFKEYAPDPNYARRSGL